uniref:Uncharacterized protein n=1 Tax=Anguilla anguilla TaxID=7936 RepID=A0A0E9RQ60_ANGAN
MPETHNQDQSKIKGVVAKNNKQNTLTTNL